MISECKNFTETISFPVRAIENQCAIIDQRKTDVRIKLRLLNT